MSNTINEMIRTRATISGENRESAREKERWKGKID